MLSLYVHTIQLTQRLRRDTKAVTAVEYGLIAGLISVVIIAAATSIGGSLKTVFEAIQAGMTAAAT